jgi:hypothetical protein
MDTVENDARCETFVGKGHANNTGFAGAHGGHCIEEVCNSTKPPSMALIKVSGAASL